MESIAFLDWDNSLTDRFTLVPWLKHLGAKLQDAAFVDAAALVERWIAVLRPALLAGTLPRDDYDRFAVDAEMVYCQVMDGRVAREVRQAAKSFSAEQPLLRDGAKDLVARLVQLRWRPVVVSGAPIEVLRAYSRRLGILTRDIHAWELSSDGDRYVGRLASGNTAREEVKWSLVEELRRGSHVELGLGDNHDADEPLWRYASIRAQVHLEDHGVVSWSSTSGALAPDRGTLRDLAAALR
ncbi:MAG: haloacid dehalogenase-like hydrolase [Chloroflexota bacterium]